MRGVGLKLSMLLALVFGISGSCSTGSDPEDIIDDVFSQPLEFCLQIHNIVNDMAMDVNAIVMNNLDTNKDTIDDEIASCVTPVIHRTNEIIDSVVIDYGTTTCTSNGGRFKGLMIVDPSDESLRNFEIRLSEFYSNGFDIRGVLNFSVADELGRDFSFTMANAEFDYKDSNDSIFTFQVTSIASDFTFIKSEDEDIDFVDDIFEFTTSFDGANYEGTPFSLNSQESLTYAYSCNNIIGGTALFQLTDIGEGIVDYGGGDTFDDCDGDVTVTAEGGVITIGL